MSSMQALVTRAIRLATLTVEELAERVELSTSALRRYRQGTRKATPDLLKRLAQFLKAHAKALNKMADQLEHAARSSKEE